MLMMLALNISTLFRLNRIEKKIDKDDINWYFWTFAKCNFIFNYYSLYNFFN
jgi:hypothetical protein